MLPGKLNTSMADRRGIEADASLGPRTLSSLNGLTKERIEQRAQRLSFGSCRRRVAHLRLNLHFAKHQRIQAACRREEMRNRCRAGAGIERRCQRPGRETMKCMQELDERRASRGCILCDTIDLDPIARRKDGRLLQKGSRRAYQLLEGSFELC